MSSRRSFLASLGTLSLAACGPSVADWARSASSLIPNGTATTPAPLGLATSTPTPLGLATPSPSPAATAAASSAPGAASPTPTPTLAPAPTPTRSPFLPQSTTTQWGVQISPSDDPARLLAPLQALRPAWIHVLFDPATAPGIVALAQAVGSGVFFITSYDTQAVAKTAATYAGMRMAWDILNEPDNSITQAFISPIDYIALVNTQTTAIKSVAPNHLVCVGSCSGKQSVDPQWYKVAFGEGLLATNTDAVGFHPYGGGSGFDGNPPFTLIANGYKGLIAQFGGHQQAWNTEWGQSSATRPQAADLLSWASSLNGVIPVAIWYSMRDASTDNSREGSFGLLDYNYNPKAVFQTAVSVFTG